MFNFLLCVQIIAFLAGLISVFLIASQNNTTLAKIMLLTCACSMIQNAGYLMEMTSNNISEAMIAVRFEYIGSAYIATWLFIFVFRYCRIRLPKWVIAAMISLDSLVLVCVWSYEHTNLYYTSTKFEYSGLFPHVVLGKGVLYVIFAIVLYIQLLVSAVVTMVSVLRTPDKVMKRNYLLLFFSSIIPILFHMLGVSGLVGAYDPAPVGGAIGIMIFAYAIILRNVFDIVEIAHENIMLNMQDAVVVLDYRNGFLEANKSAMRLFPTLSETQYGEPVPNEEFNRLLSKDGERELVIGDRFYDVHINEVANRGSMVGRTVILFDVTDRKYQLERMSELRVAADSANQAKSAFLASVSHEIRTPINVVCGMSDVILRDYKDPQLLGYANNIQNAAHSLLSLINDILDFSKIESGHIVIATSKFDANRFFTDIISTFRNTGHEKGIAFDIKVSKTIPKYLIGDEIRIKQIATNLLSNAFKYTREGSVILRAAFEKMADDKGNLIISVEDTGIGITKENMDRLFEVFVRLDERINQGIEGTGLGLNITKQLLDAMGGEIKVYSEYGKGSVFTAIIPLSVQDANEMVGELGKEIELPMRKKLGYTAPSAKVLVVDDSKTNLIVATALLRDTKVHVDTVLSGEECLEKIKEEHYDVIFLDHRMSKMDGVETLHNMKLFRHKSEGVPVIMLTANALSDVRDYYIGEGFTDFLSKPISEETITTMLRKHLPKTMIIENEE